MGYRGGGEVRRVIVSVGQNQKTVFLQTDSLADTKFFTKKQFFFRRKICEAFIMVRKSRGCTDEKKLLDREEFQTIYAH